MSEKVRGQDRTGGREFVGQRQEGHGLVAGPGLSMSKCLDRLRAQFTVRVA
jgi:hypothetical protein